MPRPSNKKPTNKIVVHQQQSSVRTISNTEREIVSVVFLFNLVGCTVNVTKNNGMVFTDLKIEGFEAKETRVRVGDEQHICYVPIRIITECGRNFSLAEISDIVVEK